MKIEIFTKYEDLLNQLEFLYQQDSYIFRGQFDAEDKLIPSAFRSEKINEAIGKFPIKKEEIERKWFESDALRKEISLWLKIPNFSYARGYPINRLLDFLVYLMRYNYSLHKYWLTETNQKNICLSDKKILKPRPEEFWVTEETFLYLVSSYLPVTSTIYHLNGTIIKDAQPFEDITGVDESFPQHYGIPTTALDWTYNPYISIYFALDLDNEKFHLQSELYVAKKIPAEYFSIYAFRQISTTDSHIQIKDKNALINNQRALRQEGTFIYFVKSCSYYLQSNRFPSIESYDNNSNKSFDLIKYNLLRTDENITFLRNLLEEKGINKNYLFPDLSN